MPKISKLVSALTRAAERRALIRFARSTVDPDGTWSYGCVVGLGRTFLLTHHVSDRLDLDGYEAVRLAEITALQTEFDSKRAIKRALRLKGQSPRRPGPINLDSEQALLSSVARRYPLLAIERERVAPDEAEVGQIKMLGDVGYALRWMSPAARWEEDERVYRYQDITRVVFGSEYETSLAALAGLVEWDCSPWAKR